MFIRDFESEFTFQESESLEWMELKELQDIMDDGYPEPHQISRYTELAEKLEPDRLLLLPSLQDEYIGEKTVTNFEHQDRPSDDRLRHAVYDGVEAQMVYFSLGKSISFATPNFKWIRSPSPFNGSKDYNTAIYRYCHECIDEHTWVKISGFTQKCLRNHLQAWLEIPEFIKEKGIPSLAKYLTCFVFGEIVTEYREKVISTFPQYFSRTRSE
ncbi:MAG: hypothetical protein QY317_16570 [Candidatus Jettenia caeni]|nr:MAG: hypothetical protein QY317_16570 [Candidatus Jettenia caeni]